MFHISGLFYFLSKFIKIWTDDRKMSRISMSLQRIVPNAKMFLFSFKIYFLGLLNISVLQKLLKFFYAYVSYFQCFLFIPHYFIFLLHRILLFKKIKHNLNTPTHTYNFNFHFLTREFPHCFLCVKIFLFNFFWVWNFRKFVLQFLYGHILSLERFSIFSWDIQVFPIF